MARNGTSTKQMNVKVCKDCAAGGQSLRNPRPATYPGPRCYTHHQDWRKASKQRAHRLRTETNFGLPAGGYDALLAVQDGRCGGCGKTPGPAARRMAVDHDHKCCPGTTSCGLCVRGLLCYDCNSEILPRVGNDPEKLRRLAEYLVNWPSRKVAWQ